MRNLKKILALVLALVMSFSLMATANAFTDDEKITDTYETAVTVLSGLKVFQGYDDGSFLPQGSITRAEVAAIIYRIVTGDVNDTQVGIYADYNKFDDVKSTSWYAGYVNFCANAEYIKGYDAKTFGPNDPVTGYQALAMILRALGYDKNGEFTGSNWQVQTAAVGENRGITKNITAGTLGVAATREVVAEILFRAILVDTVNYTPAFGYQLNDTSLGWDTFELEEIEGVVIANEYADLYNTEALRAGRTELNVDGESYMLNYTTTLQDIGEARAAYITEGKNVLAIGDAGNTVFETGAATDISTDKKFESATGLEAGEAEYFLNFDGGDSYKASDWRIEYKYATDAKEGDALEKANGGNYDDGIYTKTIKAGGKLTAIDMKLIKEIFVGSDDDTDNNEYIGEVFVGTQSGEDISDKISYKQFLDKYIETSENAVEIKDTDNGEWLKVIDNNGDGIADIVLKTEFAMSIINRISKDNEYTFAELANDKNDKVAFNDTVKVDGDDIITEDELAEDDVVIYTLIDGNYFVNVAEKVTATVDKKGINSKTETMTCDGTDYVQSHIGYTNEVYHNDVTEAHTEYTYDLYLDHFGFVRLFIESDYNVFMLLTDGYFETDRRDDTFKAEYWNVEAAEKQDIDVADAGDVEEFIDVEKRADDEGWDRLFDAGYTYLNDDERFITNIAGYSSSDDAYTLKRADDSTQRVGYAVKGLNIADTDLDDRQLTADNGDRIQTTTNTQYYLVIKDTDRHDNVYVKDVITWTGYKNVPDGAELGENADAYAVTHVGSKNDQYGYDIADVVVFETNAYADRNTYFVYETNNWNVEYVWGIGYGEDDKIVDDRVYVDIKQEPAEIEFYEIFENGAMNHIDENYDDYNIYAGEVDVRYNVSKNDYIQVRDTAAGTLRFNPEEIAIYKVVKADGDFDVKAISNWDDIKLGAKMILFTDSKENVEYAIIVDMSVNANDNVFPAVKDLYKAIVADAAPVAEATDPADYLRSAEANTIKADLTGKGDGSYDKPFEMVATGCLNGVTKTTLDVSAVTTKQVIKVAYELADVDTTPYTGEGDLFVEYGTNATPVDGNKWYFSINGVYFHVVMDALNHESTVSAKNNDVVKVAGETITVKTSYGDASTLTEANLLAALDIPEGAVAEYSYTAGETTGTLTVTPECGEAATVYTVAFDANLLP